jgi:hypothetical protein
MRKRRWSHSCPKEELLAILAVRAQDTPPTHFLVSGIFTAVSVTFGNVTLDSF